MASFQKQLAVFMLLFWVAIIAKYSGSPNMMVMAVRDLPLDVAIMEQALFPNGGITCQRSCKTNNDCSDGIFCRRCHYFPKENVRICLAA
ncbi:uncharacterized protein LOC132042320 [Lycium ferocissimum]|uniref:uncharacterized protein LOC132042320 n=1 Tax=Lycium ferocissimum TaxID=112874 RepID=UPI002814B875|nr:uncharacterized protein LOC132042320 [Lycium ferocissimum]